MRKVKLTAIILALIFIFAGCNLVEVNPERDLDTVVAKVNGEEILKKDYIDAYDLSASQAYMEGYTKDDINNDKQAFIDSVIENTVMEKIIVQKAISYGCYDFTQEELDTIDEQYESLIEGYIGIAESAIQNDDTYSGYTDEEKEKLVDEKLAELLDSIGINKENLYKQQKDGLAAEKLYEIIAEVEEPTESELLEAYNEIVPQYEAFFLNDPTQYKDALDRNATIYYNIADVRQTTHILISFSDDVKNEIRTLRATDEDAANTLREKELEKIKDKADEVYALANEGRDFRELIDEYGEDSGMETIDYYTVVKEATQFAPEYVEALFALENVGDFTKLIASDFGYHIILYYEEVPEGPVAFEDVRDSVKEDLLAKNRQEMYIAQLETWREESKVKIYNNRLDIDLE